MGVLSINSLEEETGCLQLVSLPGRVVLPVSGVSVGPLSPHLCRRGRHGGADQLNLRRPGWSAEQFGNPERGDGSGTGSRV